MAKELEKIQDNNSNVSDDNLIKQRNEEIANHNASISTQIAKLEETKERYIKVKGQSSSITSELDSLATSASSVSSSLENIVISGKSFDDGNFKMINNNLQSMSSTFSNIVNVCNTKISNIEKQIQDLKTQYL